MRRNKNAKCRHRMRACFWHERKMRLRAEKGFGLKGVKKHLERLPVSVCIGIRALRIIAQCQGKRFPPLCFN